MRRSLTFGLGLALMTLPALGQTRSKPVCTAPTVSDRLQGLTPEGDLALASGRLAKLAHIRLPSGPPYRDAALAWLRARIEQPVLVQGDASSDRWGRVSVRLRLTDDLPSFDLAHGLVTAGLAMIDPGSAEVFCQPELLVAEEEAREQRLGLWADASYNPINAEHVDRLQDRIGSFVLVEGRVRSIGERSQRTYLNFGGHWAEDFTIIIPQKTWKLMADRGSGAEALKGRRIRARGILQSWQGTALTIVIPEMIEHLEGRRLSR